MNTDRFAGICKQFKGAMKESWGNLTHNLLVVAAGEREQLDGRRQERHGAWQEHGSRKLEEFLARNRKWDQAIPSDYFKRH